MVFFHSYIYIFMYNGSYKIKDRISNWLRSVLFFSCWRFRFGNHPGCRPWKHRLCDQLRNSRSMVYVPAVGAIDPEKTPLDWFNIYRNPIQNKNIPEEMNLLMSHERKPMFHGAPTIFFPRKSAASTFGSLAMAAVAIAPRTARTVSTWGGWWWE